MFIFHSYRSSSPFNRWVYDDAEPVQEDLSAPKEAPIDPNLPKEEEKEIDFDFDFDANYEGLDLRIKGPIDTEVPADYKGEELTLDAESVFRELDLDGNPEEKSEREQQIIQVMTQKLNDFDAVMEHNLQSVRVEHGRDSKQFKQLREWAQKQYESVLFQAKIRVLQANVEEASDEMKYEAKIGLVTDYVGASEELTQLLLRENDAFLDEIFEPLPKTEVQLKRRIYAAIERRDLKNIIKEGKQENPYTKSRSEFVEDRDYFLTQIDKSIENIEGDVGTAYTDAIGEKRKKKLATLLAKEYNVIDKKGEKFVQKPDGTTWTLDYFESSVLPDICKTDYDSMRSFKNKRKELRRERRAARRDYHELRGVPLVGRWSRTDMARPRNLKNNKTLDGFLEGVMQRRAGALDPINNLEDEENYGERGMDTPTDSQPEVMPADGGEESFSDRQPEVMPGEITDGKKKVVEDAELALEAIKNNPDFSNIFQTIADLIATLKAKSGPGDYGSGVMELGEITAGLEGGYDVVKDRKDAKEAYRKVIDSQQPPPTLEELMNGLIDMNPDPFNVLDPGASASPEAMTAFIAAQEYPSQKYEAIKEYIQDHSDITKEEWKLESVDKEGAVFEKEGKKIRLLKIAQKGEEVAYIFKKIDEDSQNSFVGLFDGDKDKLLFNLGHALNLVTKNGVKDQFKVKKNKK